jgi:DNA uptake protein ComE-like DNA-binding protein
MIPEPMALRRLLVLLPAAFVLGACATPAATEAPAESAAPQATVAEVVAAPTAEGLQPTTAPAIAAVAKLNLNTATEAEFLTVSGVGEKMVDEFNEYRPYSSILAFRREIGKYVEPAQVAEYEKYLFVPVKVNDADADTLQQLPGVTPEIAAQLIAGRPYADNAAFSTALAALVTADEAAAAAAFLDPQ